MYSLLNFTHLELYCKHDIFACFYKTKEIKLKKKMFLITTKRNMWSYQIPIGVVESKGHRRNIIQRSVPLRSKQKEKEKLGFEYKQQHKPNLSQISHHLLREADQKPQQVSLSISLCILCLFIWVLEIEFGSCVARCRTRMAAVPGQLIWEIVKKNNSFLVKEFGNGTASVQFSKEPNNLYNLNSYKHSGLTLSLLFCLVHEKVFASYMVLNSVGIVFVLSCCCCVFVWRF